MANVHDGQAEEPFAGIYSITHAVRYLTGAGEYSKLQRTFKVDNRKLLRWVRAGLSEPSLATAPGRDLVLTFEDLISMRIVALMRAAGVSFRKIYVAEEWLREHTGSRRPFASELLWTASSDVFAELKTRIVAASRGGQIAMDFLRDELIPVSGLLYLDQRPVSWTPHESVLIDPQIQFGASCVSGTRIPTRALWGMVAAGDRDEDVARAYGIKLDEVRAVVRWEDSLAA